MKFFYQWNFSLGAAPDFEAIKAALAKADSQVIQTSSGVCIGSTMTADQLIALFKQAGLPGADSLVNIASRDVASQTPDVKAFIGSG